MSRPIASVFGLLLTAPLALAQGQVRPATFVGPKDDSPTLRPSINLAAPRPGVTTAPAIEAPTIAADSRLRFSPLEADVRLDGNRWQLWAGRMMLKDFGPK